MTGKTPQWLIWLAAAGGVLVTGAFLVLVRGNPWLGLLPPVGILVAWAAWRLPSSVSVPILLFLVLAADDPGSRPMHGLWDPPTETLGLLLFVNMNTSMGLSALHFAAIEAIMIAFVAGLWLRMDRGDEGRLPLAVRPMLAVLGLVLAWQAVMVFWGATQGGNLRQALWQMRQIGWLPIMILLFMAGLRGPRGWQVLIRVVVGVAVLHAIQGLYFYFFIAVPQGLSPAYITTHADSVLFVVALFLLLHGLLEYPDRRHFAGVTLALPLLTVALILNDRRLAFVALLGVLAAMLFLLRPALRRRVAVAVVAVSPLIAAYFVAGWNSEAPAFRPVASIRSVMDETDGSTRSREIENTNLILTMWRSPVVGHGYGHPYHEFEAADDLSSRFEQFRYLPHNSVLGLLMNGGIVGFLVIWMVQLMGVFLALRGYRRSTTALQRRITLGTVAAVIAYGVQAYGDIGMQAWGPTFVLAAFLAAGTRVAARVGAWRPAPARARVRAPSAAYGEAR